MKYPYPEEFVQKIKKEYLEWPGFSKILEVALTSGDDAGVECLLKAGKSLNQNITADQILGNLKAGCSNNVLKVAEKCLRRQELYKEWIGSRLNENGNHAVANDF